MSENYLVLDGKRIDLTEEQIRTLGFEVKKDYFSRTLNGTYYFIDTLGDVLEYKDNMDYDENVRHKVANYCTNKELMQQRALHEILDRLLWRFSMENDGYKINWEDDTPKHSIVKNNNEIVTCKYINNVSKAKSLSIYFYSEEIAKRAIEEIIKPFIKKHPEFVW